MFNKAKRKRKQKKGKRQPVWQIMLPWFLLAIAFAMLGYAYMLENRPTPTTVQTIQDRGMAERTPEFGSDTRDLTGQASSEVTRPDNIPAGASESNLRDRVIATEAQSDRSPQLCEWYSISGCED